MSIAPVVEPSPGEPRQDVTRILAEQCRLQLGIVRARAAPIAWLFVIGLAVAGFALFTALAMLLMDRPALPFALLAGFFTLQFGWAVTWWLVWPLRLAPRIVPYFARELAPYGGATMEAFRRGSSLRRAIPRLDEITDARGVKALSTFGFGYDHFGQEVRWHDAREGLRTVAALQRALESSRHAEPDLADDLEALASVLRLAAAQGTAFSLVVRLTRTESMQGVCTREERAGSFW